MTIRSTLLGIWAIFWVAAAVCWFRARGNGRLSREGVLFLLLGMPFLVAGWFFTKSSYPQELVFPTPAPVPVTVAAGTPVATPPPPPTPSPRTYTDAVIAAQHAAVKRYPDLGRAGTPFNSRFVAVYRLLRYENPGYFTDPEWPLRLADEVARTQLEPP